MMPVTPMKPGSLSGSEVDFQGISHCLITLFATNLPQFLALPSVVGRQLTADGATGKSSRATVRHFVCSWGGGAGWEAPWRKCEAGSVFKKGEEENLVDIEIKEEALHRQNQTD